MPVPWVKEQHVLAAVYGLAAGGAAPRSGSHPGLEGAQYQG